MPLYPHEPGRAEFSIAIADAWQHNGLGRILLTMLLDYARENGIEAILAMILGENRGMWSLIQSLPYETESTIEYGVYEIWIDLPPQS